MYKKSLTFFLVVLMASALMLNCSNGGGAKDETPPANGGATGDITLPTSDSGSNAIIAKAAAASTIDQGFHAGSILLLAQLMPEMEKPDKGGADPKNTDNGDDDSNGGDSDDDGDSDPFGDLNVTPAVVDINSCVIGEYKYTDLSCLDEGIEHCSADLQKILAANTETTCNVTPAIISADYITVDASISSSALLKFNCPFSDFLTTADGKCKNGSEEMKSYTMTVNFGTDPAVIAYTLKDPESRDLPLGDKTYSVTLPSGEITVKVKGEGIFTAIAGEGSTEQAPSFTDCKENDFSFTLSTDLKEISIKEGESTTTANTKIDDVLFDVESVACNPTLDNPAATFTMNKPLTVSIGDETYNCGGTIIDNNYDKFFCAVSE